MKNLEQFQTLSLNDNYFRKKNACLPLISIITSNLNSGFFLEKTILSMKNCNYPFVEYIVVDGKSTDDSIDIINKYQFVINKLISEKDTGIYDAWNKGLRIASGEYIAFLGAGDIYIEGGLRKLVNAVLVNPNVDFVSSKIEVISPKAKMRKIGDAWAWGSFRRHMRVAHPGALHSRRLFNKYGEFNSRYRIAGDYEFLLRAKNNLKASFINQVTVQMLAGGISQIGSKSLFEAEEAKLEQSAVNWWVARYDRYYGQFKKFFRDKFYTGI